MKQCTFAVCESILCLAGYIFPDFSYHFPLIRSMKDIAPGFWKFYMESVTALADQQLILSHSFYRSSQIGCKSVFFLISIKKSHAPGKVHSSQGDGCRCDHDGSSRNEMLRPDIFVRKGSSAVSFHISQTSLKNNLLLIQTQPAFYCMLHTVNGMSALHSRNTDKRPHNIIFRYCKLTEAQSPSERYFISICSSSPGTGTRSP